MAHFVCLGIQHEYQAVTLLHSDTQAFFQTTFAKYRQFIENCFAVMPRHALHARLLGFEHPATHENVLFESPLPADFQSLLTKWNIYTSAAKETKEN